ncbi:MAG: mechanosensitive ion channel [Terracidiphilus sp.]|nr:mechanosensitive ion channel [Terracidiphilus sp.]MDR3777338.1 mechanosensitive ion channel [Terracidiphilus sp.]
MAILSGASLPNGAAGIRIFGRARLIVLLVLVALLALCMAFSWTTRDAMMNLPFLGHGPARRLVGGEKTLVDMRPWQTAQALAPLAVTAEETEYARDAERLADHEVDQAFAAALRLANIQVQQRVLSGEALALSQKVAQLQQTVKEDQAQVKALTASSSVPSASAAPASGAKDAAAPAAEDDDLEIAKAQLGLDSDQLADAQDDLDRASGDNRALIQSELTAHEAAMTKYDAESHSERPIAVLSAARHGTLATRLKSWNNQIDRKQLIQQALQQTQADIASLTAEHNALEAKANAAVAATGANVQDRAARLANLRDRSAERQLLSIYDDRIQTQKQLAGVYSKWSAQVQLQHRTLGHLILQSLALICFILICTVLCDALVRRLLDLPAIDRRQRHTLRTVLELAVQVLGGVIILLVIFGSPRQLTTVLGLTTAGLTIALQDFILAFFGWFVLMGRHGMRVGDWVEINGVGGEVTEIGLMSTTLLETGDLAERGHPTGRRITFLNSFAIRGQYFNFSTTGQWMWDEITVSLPATEDAQAMVESIHKAVEKETKQSALAAQKEWKRGMRDDGLSLFSADPVVNLRPSTSGIEIQVRYVTRASERFGVRNRLYQHVIDLLQKGKLPEEAKTEPSSGN